MGGGNADRYLGDAAEARSGRLSHSPAVGWQEKEANTKRACESRLWGTEILMPGESPV